MTSMHTDFSKSKSCIHTKNIFSLMDMPKNDEAYRRLHKHIDQCPTCSTEYKTFGLQSQAAQIYIPKMMMDRDLKQSFETEVAELFKVMNLNDREALKRNVKKSLSFIDSMGADFLRNLFSKSMIKAYCVAVACYLSLKYFFS